MADPADRRGADNTGKHGQARQMADKAMELEARGNQEEAERLYDEATRADPEAVAAALHEAVTPRLTPEETRPARDREVAAMTREVRPRADAPDRAGVTGPGSGADGQ